MSSIQIIRVAEKKPVTPSTLHREIEQLGLNPLGANSVKVYYLEGITEGQAEFLAQKIFAESLSQTYSINALAAIRQQGDHIVTIGYKPGVMNPEVASILQAAQLLNIPLQAVETACENHLYGLEEKEVILVTERLLMNKTTQRIITEEPTTLLFADTPSPPIQIIKIRRMTNRELEKVSKEGQLFLNLEEMRLIRQYFQSIKRDPTDVELETIAQTWSEHCCHKTFNARLVFNGTEIKPLFTRLKEVSKKYFGKKVLSAFHDNAGVMDFYEGFVIAAKKETHNSPSALEPYGGAATGVGGVLRDIVGCGLGFLPIASTDEFCFANPTCSDIPPGCLHPRTIMRGVVAGVRDYGNRMGVPTINGSVVFDDHFVAKPTVLVGAYGIAKKQHAQKGRPRKGDIIVTIGGSIGRDGIHGATFSSGAMTATTSTTNATAVQIGNAIEQKRMFEAIIACRDQGIIRAITDCGAGGLSSAIGEMGKKTGVLVELSKAPVKYPGLAAWERWISEAQERMIVAVAPRNLNQLITTCQSYNVPATAIGHFTDNQTLTVLFEGETVCSLSMDFLHNGMPQRKMKATYSELRTQPQAIPESPDIKNDWLAIMGHLNVCSRQPITQQYDHGVQGTAINSPYTEIDYGSTPSDAAVIAPLNGKSYGLVISHGIGPNLMGLDPYRGGMSAIIEAVANLVATGGDPEEMAFMDNFIWPYPTPEQLGRLSKAVDACVDGAHLFKTPFISGKDSLYATYTYPDGKKLEIPGVLCISAFSRISNVKHTMTTRLKRNESTIFLLGEMDFSSMGGSVYLETKRQIGGQVPLPLNLETLRNNFIKIHQLLKSGHILACHDIKEGGIAVAITEMAMGSTGTLGATIITPEGVQIESFLFNETPGCFIVEVARGLPMDHDELFDGIPYLRIGTTNMRGQIVLAKDINMRPFLEIPLRDMKESWENPLEEVFA